MRKKKGIAEVVVIVLLILIVLASYTYMNAPEKEVEKTKTSVVVYGSDPERWVAFEQGVTQAASDLEASVNFVVMTDPLDWKEQVELLEREQENGAEGMVTAIANSYHMGTDVLEVEKEIPIILVENELEANDSLCCVAADGRQMGAALAGQILKDQRDAENIWVMLTKTERSSQVERLAGFEETIKAAGKEIAILEQPSEEEVQELLAGENIVVGLEDLMLEWIAEKAVTEITADIYGIGSTQKIVFALDNGVISGIVFQNEFNMGYEAMRHLLNKIRHSNMDAVDTVDYHMVTKETLHLPENERLLYPITQ